MFGIFKWISDFCVDLYTECHEVVGRYIDGVDIHTWHPALVALRNLWADCV